MRRTKAGPTRNDCKSRPIKVINDVKNGRTKEKVTTTAARIDEELLEIQYIFKHFETRAA